MRKAVITENGTAVTEVVTVAISTINQPVNIQVPAADQPPRCRAARSAASASPPPVPGIGR